MHEVHLSSVLDILLVAVPFVVVLALAVFRLNTLFAAPQASPHRLRRRSGCGIDANGEPLLVDPDGRPSDRPS